jgi:hypothetical protein
VSPPKREDPQGFTGAGLYTSVSVAVAYDEREQALVDHSLAAMGELVEPAFTNEHGNGVAISRNVLDPVYGDAYYFNAQTGEASVTNPAPGMTSEKGTYLFSFGRAEMPTDCREF